MTIDDLHGWYLHGASNRYHLFPHYECTVCGTPPTHEHPLTWSLCETADLRGPVEFVDLCVVCFGIWSKKNPGSLVAARLMG